jgi:Protein of unknown function (DUF3037)
VPARCSFEYAVVRVVPRVDREEFVNVGAALYCRERGHLEARIELDEARLRALAPDADVALVRRHLDAIARLCAGGPGAGAIGALPLAERWRWLVAPRSTIVQTSPAHVGVGEALEAAMERILDQLVRAPRAGG